MYIKDCFRSMAGYQERPHFLLEFAPGGSRHKELVVEKNEEEIQADNASTMVNELPSKLDEFLEVIKNIIVFTCKHFSFSASIIFTLMVSWI